MLPFAGGKANGDGNEEDDGGGGESGGSSSVAGSMFRRSSGSGSSSGSCNQGPCRRNAFQHWKNIVPSKHKVANSNIHRDEWLRSEKRIHVHDTS